MNKALRLLTALGTGLALTVSALLLFSLLPSLGEGTVSPEDATLVNGGFEGTYEDWEGSTERP